jgi:hypothetical protein
MHDWMEGMVTIQFMLDTLFGFPIALFYSSRFCSCCWSKFDNMLDQFPAILFATIPNSYENSLGNINADTEMELSKASSQKARFPSNHLMLAKGRSL